MLSNKRRCFVHAALYTGLTFFSLYAQNSVSTTASNFNHATRSIAKASQALDGAMFEYDDVELDGLRGENSSSSQGAGRSDYALTASPNAITSRTPKTMTPDTLSELRSDLEGICGKSVSNPIVHSAHLQVSRLHAVYTVAGDSDKLNTVVVKELGYIGDYLDDEYHSAKEKSERFAFVNAAATLVTIPSALTCAGFALYNLFLGIGYVRRERFDRSRAEERRKRSAAPPPDGKRKKKGRK